MTWKLALPALAAWLCLGQDVAAQVIVGPSYGGGIAIRVGGTRVRIGGYAPAGPGYGPGVVILTPPPLTVIDRTGTATPPPRPQLDLSGIDLDLERPDKLFPSGSAPQRREPERLPAPKPVEANKLPPPAPVKAPPPAPVKLPPPAEVKPPPVQVPPPPVVKPPPPVLPLPAPVKPAPKPKQPPIDDLWRPQPGAADEARRLTELGTRAFQAGNFGVALFRFRQASDIDPNQARPFFLLGQAHLAAAEFDAAVQAIHAGLKLNPDWPRSDFRPRADLFGDRVADWLEQRVRLDDALKRKPDDAGLLFLRGYAAWFEGQREQAVEWFMKARVRTADPHDIDLFLKHAPRPAVAAG